MPAIRVRPGHVAAIVDVSETGALVETERGLPPGATVELQMEIDARRCVVRGRVLRCAVAQLRAAGVKYRSAIAFEQPVPWFMHSHGYLMPARGTGEDRAARADATQDAI